MFVDQSRFPINSMIIIIIIVIIIIVILSLATLHTGVRLSSSRSADCHRQR